MINAALLLLASGTNFVGQSAFEAHVAAARASNVVSKPIGERMAFFGQRMLGTPYVGWTLEQDVQREYCFVTLDGLDCVTFMEVALGLARIPWRSRPEARPQDLIDAVTFTRYRGGRVDGYLSRLHYTSDWIADNVRKGVVRDVSPGLPGARRMATPIHFMSSNAKVYRQLAANPGLLPELKRIEARLSRMDKWYVPSDRAVDAEKLLRTGDIIAIADSRRGMDYAHVGMIIVRDGAPRFVHASSVEKKVVFDVSLSEYLKRNPRQIGFSAARPLEP